MRIPVMCGVIDRRILANYRVAPEYLQKLLPAPFRPQLVDGWGIAGICLIRLKKVRPRFFPLPIGLSSENAAHRIAVEWDEGGQLRQGVYVPRRDTNSLLNVIAGGRLFPGVHHHARFDVREEHNRLSVEMTSHDGQAHILIRGQVAQQWSPGSVFPALDAASKFFQQGSLGYSPASNTDQFDGLELRTKNWHVEPLAVAEIQSSFFDDTRQFPSGTVKFDCALLMRNIDHEWHSRQTLCCEPRLPDPPGNTDAKPVSALSADGDTVALPQHDAAGVLKSR